MKTIIFIGGYAESGKTTSINYLKTLGIPCFSTSELLHHFCFNTYKYIMGIELETQNKIKMVTLFPFNSAFRSIKVSMREFLIYVAENLLTKTFGRGIFALGIKNQIETCPSNLVIIETIGGKEYYELNNCFSDTEYNKININIRSYTEKPGIDIRELLPKALEINNNESVQKLYIKLEEQLKNVKLL
jgi:hypothetical protein